MPRVETVAIIVTPLVAMATFALGLETGASRAVHAAVVYAAPPSAGRAGLAWQLLTVNDERGVREAIALSDVSVIARSGGHEATWRGATNADGIGEAWLALPDVHMGDRVDLVVRAAGDPIALAEGSVRWEPRPWGPASAGPAWVRPSKREGDLAIDVTIDGGKLAPGFATRAWVRVVGRASGRPVAGSMVEAEADPGLSLAAPRATPCPLGLAELVLTAEMHVVGLGLRATAPDGSRGEWYGSVPVAPGGSSVTLPSRTAPGAPLPLRVLVPTVRPLIYLEVDDHAGRAFAATLPVRALPGELPQATVEVPSLGAGIYWVVTSGEPRGAESLAVAAIARPLIVAEGTSVDECKVRQELASAAAAPFPRWVALDGAEGRHARDGGRRRRGVFLALGSLAVAAVLETLLVLRSVARSRHEMAKVAQELDPSSPATELTARMSAVSVAIGLLLGLLGFALIAALLTWKAG